jgi:leucyl-tRNA synthetase
VWNFFSEPANITETDDGKLTKIYHQTVKKVTSDFEMLGFNTAIAQMMVFVNEVYKNGTCPREYAEGFIKMISCIIPHVGEELWQLLGHDNTIAYESWPAYSEEKCKDSEINIAVQVNGKMRGTVLMEADLDNDAVVANVVANEKIAAFLQKQGGSIVKTIVVKNKLVNLIVK